MAGQVIKKDGTKESFDEGKVRRSIESAVKEGGVEEEKAGEVANRVINAALEFVSSKEEVTSAELSEKILGELEAADPRAAEAWKNYKK